VQDGFLLQCVCSYFEVLILADGRKSNIKFKYISTRKSWEIALTDGSFLRLKANLRAKDLCTYNEEFVQIHQSYIINMHYLHMIQNNRCLMTPPFHYTNELYISQKYKRELTARFCLF
jgi:two-component system, LytTR family, response regulator